ncbi:TrmH family RNA methyltransferase [Saprospira grandis]|uniref:TrmH family RNA methyltransferase n=1 Tax=Saprospira grandis TaxID=1008 RepID=UPI0022DE44F1|nr:TrmH family RNA methyltransferase [Saprospira grandis]WBM75624.1 TrmH family RNA methyltransferase [Saprospira grandis]
MSVPQLSALLHAPQYRPNLSSMIRTAEFYGLKKIYIYDQNDLLLPPGKSKFARAEMEKMARVWTAGAIEHIEVIPVLDVADFLANYPGRKMATWVDPSAKMLHEVQFEAQDLLIVGNEKTGLPEEVAPLIDQKIYIQGHGQTSCLNVAVSFGILMQTASTQLLASK